MFLSSLVLSLALSTQIAPEPELYPLIRLADFMPALTDADRTGEQASEFVQRNGEDPLSWTPPQVEIRAREDMSRTRVSVAFNWVWLSDEPGRRPVWFARLRAMDWTHTVERFADSRQCPGVEAALRRLDALPVINSQIPALPDPDGPPPKDFLGVGYLHDNTYVIRLTGALDGESYGHRLELVGGSGSGFAPAVAESLTFLKLCWTETPPPRA